MGAAPLPHALDMGRAGEVIAVAWLLEPAVLTRGFAHLPACRLGAVALATSATRVGIKKGLTVLTLTLPQWTSHEPASPQAHDQRIGAWKEENGAEKMRTEEEQKTRKKGGNISGGEEDGIAVLTISS
jgi:hypothetical protein